MKTKFLFFLTLLQTLLLFPAIAQRFEVDGITYEKQSYSSEVAVVRGQRSYSGSIYIPSSVSYQGRSYNVRAIGEGAFKDSYVSSVNLPYSLNVIGDAAFKGCRALWRISIPSNVSRIGQSCFEDCTSLRDVEFSYNNFRELPYRCFRNCNSLRTIRMPQYITSIGDACFEDCRSLVELVLPSRVETIGRDAFRACRSLREITLPNYLRRMGSYCFGSCYNLRTIISECRNPYNLYESTVFRGDGVNLYNQATLYVPRGSRNSYLRTNGWRDFQKVVEK